MASASRVTWSPTREVVEDVSDLLGEVVDDLYVRKYMDTGEPEITRAEAMQIAREVGREPGLADRAARRVRRRRSRRCARGWPAACGPSSSARKRALSVITYDDLLTRLRDELAGRARAAGGRAAARALPRRARRRVPGHRPDPVGDPAARVRGRRRDARADRRSETGDLRLPRRRRLLLPGGQGGVGGDATLEVNWRSDQGLIDAYDAMFGGAKLGHPEIVYGRVRARRRRASRSPIAGRAAAGAGRGPLRPADREDPPRATRA